MKLHEVLSALRSLAIEWYWPAPVDMAYISFCLTVTELGSVVVISEEMIFI